MNADLERKFELLREDMHIIQTDIKKLIKDVGILQGKAIVWGGGAAIIVSIVGIMLGKLIP